MSKHMTDAAFMAWCESSKVCTYCRRSFVGPVCECEWPQAAATYPPPTPVTPKRAARAKGRGR